MISEWLRVMLEEISSKKAEAERTRAEDKARAEEKARASARAVAPGREKEKPSGRDRTQG